MGVNVANLINYDHLPAIFKVIDIVEDTINEICKKIIEIVWRIFNYMMEENTDQEYITIN
jgi:hypothetical protein